MKDNTLTYISINEALDQFQSQIKVKCPYAIETGLKAMDILTGGLFPGEPRIQQASAKLRNVFVKALLWC